MWKKIEMDEAAIQLGGRRQDYGNVLILAGGAGSGKGFAYEMAIDFNGKKFDVDELKKRLIKFHPNSKLDHQFFTSTGRHLNSIDLGVPEDVKTLHMFCKDIDLDFKEYRNLLHHIKDNAEKPNIIFDVTLKESNKLTQIATMCKTAGYDAKNIHVVWILNDHEEAKKQNLERPRKVPSAILDQTHEGVSKNFKNILTKAESLVDETDGSPLVNGDFWIFFNKRNTDNFTKKSGKGGMAMTTINAVKIKSAGKELQDFDTIMDMKVKEFDKDGKMVSRDRVTVRDKISGYVPKTTSGAWSRIPDDNEDEEAEYGANARHNM